MVAEITYYGRGTGTYAHLKPAHQRGSAARIPAERRKAKRRGIGKCETLAAEKKENKENRTEQF